MLGAVSGFITWDISFFVRADPGQSELHPAFVEALNKDLNFILRAGAAQCEGWVGVLTHFPAVPASTLWLVINQAQDPELPAPASLQTTPAFSSQLGLRRQSIKYTGPVYLCVCVVLTLMEICLHGWHLGCPIPRLEDAVQNGSRCSVHLPNS